MELRTILAVGSAVAAGFAAAGVATVGSVGLVPVAIGLLALAVAA